MNVNIQSHIDNGYTALKNANWSEARRSFEQALSLSDAPEVYDGLGIACWWLNDIRAAHQYRTVAYNGFKSSQQVRKAAVIACWLAREQMFFCSNSAAMQGWFARAESLMKYLPPCSELAWCELLRSSMLDTPAELAHVATHSIQVAREFQEINLEAFALAFCGLAKVIQCQVEDGMCCLDEAMTMAINGEVNDLMVTSEIFCVMLSACETAGDLIRSEQWCQRHGNLLNRNSVPFFQHIVAQRMATS